MSFKTPLMVAAYAVEAGKKKALLPWVPLLALGFLGGAFISLGFLLDIRIIAGLPKEWGGLATFLGAAVFPLGLVLVVVAGGELLTGNMMAVPIALYRREIRWGQAAKNLAVITAANFVGAVFVAYAFGHVLGLTEAEPYLSKTIDLARHKVDQTFLQAFVSGIGCNWLVALGVWVAHAADDIAGKIVALWFPTMAFVAIGFQHVVANMFLIPAAIFAGQLTWADWLANAVPVWLGNLVGGAVFVAGAYALAYRSPERSLGSGV